MIDFFSEAAKLTGLPVGDCLSGYRYMVFSGCACYVIRHKGIKKFSPEEVLISLGKGVLSVCGEGLRLKDATSDEIMIVGKIDKVEQL